jgi:radical SAM protein with 4Fe4S-binding SPASM domain
MITPCRQLSPQSDRVYWDEFSDKIERQRIPLSGGIALTHRCNLACLHCYAKDNAGEKGERGRELSTEQWKKIIDEIREAGCLYLLITGGEPLLRDDFVVLYAYAKQQGFLVTIFSNGTLVSGETIDLFRRLPPRRLEITLYGASAATHDRVTGVPGSYLRCRRGIEMLLAGGVHVALKSVLLTLNEHELSAMEKIARGYGIEFRFDAALFPSFAGDRSALDLRVSPERAVAMEFANPEVLAEMRKFVKRFRPSAADSLYPCSAGTTVFHVDPYGYLFPCLMVRKYSYPLRSGSFQQGWNETIATIKEMKITADSECRSCGQKMLCGYCPGFFEMENGSEQVLSPYLCALGKRRSTMINPGITGG